MGFLKKIVATPRGFSLIELIVVVGIFAIISMLVLANHARFNSTVLLTSLAYDIALTAREAQVYGVSVRTFGSEFQLGYGLHFQDTKSYVFFADLNKDSIFDANDSIVKELSIGRGHTISRFCAYSTDAEYCSDSATNPIDHVNIVFVRPEPDANITTNEPVTYSRAEITVSAPGGASRVVVVHSTGQISVGD